MDQQREPDVDRTLEAVIGTDSRKRISSTLDSPWSQICCLTIYGMDGEVARGTGSLVGPRTILTAGHCVYSTLLFGGWAREVLVEPARDGDVRPFGTTTSQSFSALADWVKSEEPHADIGCIHLSKPLGDSIGYFGIDSKANVNSQRVSIAGYPVDREDGTRMYGDSGTVAGSLQGRMFYDADTVGGQSGAPIWMSGIPGEHRLVGIHAYGDEQDTSLDLDYRPNAGTRISKEVMATIIGWIIQSYGESH